MGNLISLLQEIFMLKEDNSLKVGLTCYRESSPSPVEKPQKRSHKPQELKISDLMRKGSY